MYSPCLVCRGAPPAGVQLRLDNLLPLGREWRIYQGDLRRIDGNPRWLAMACGWRRTACRLRTARFTECGFAFSSPCGKLTTWRMKRHRAVAQLGSALDWGSRGRGFKSRRPDDSKGSDTTWCRNPLSFLDHGHKAPTPSPLPSSQNKKQCDGLRTFRPDFPRKNREIVSASHHIVTKGIQRKSLSARASSSRAPSPKSGSASPRSRTPRAGIVR